MTQSVSDALYGCARWITLLVIGAVTFVCIGVYFHGRETRQGSDGPNCGRFDRVKEAALRALESQPDAPTGYRVQGMELDGEPPVWTIVLGHRANPGKRIYTVRIARDCTLLAIE